MSLPQANTLTKEERLCGKTNVSTLISGGRWGGTEHLKYCWLGGHEDSPNRILVSVPKKFFKRAVKRNLLKRRIREAYRTRKDLLQASGVDVLFQYNYPEVLPYGTICEEIETILSKIGR